MATSKKIQSIEPNIADIANGWLKSYKLDYKLEQESLNAEIDQALNDYYSKNGGVGGNRPDAKLLLKDKNMTAYSRHFNRRLNMCSDLPKKNASSLQSTNTRMLHARQRALLLPSSF